MSSTFQYSKRIADYLLGDMSQDERIAFEKDVLVDPDLAFELKRQTPLVEHLKSKAKLEEIENSPDMEEAERVVQEFYESQANIEPVSEDLDKYHNHNCQIQNILESSSKRRFLRPLLIAAAVFAGILIVWTVGISSQSDRLYSRYYEPLDGSRFTVRGGNNETYQEFRIALDQYMSKEYANSAILFQQIGENSPGFEEGRLYYGLSLIGADKHASAASVLKEYLKNHERYVPEARWYLALCYLNLDRRSEAKEILEELSAEAGVLGENSAEIVKRLKREK